MNTQRNELASRIHEAAKEWDGETATTVELRTFQFPKGEASLQIAVAPIEDLSASEFWLAAIWATFEGFDSFESAMKYATTAVCESASPHDVRSKLADYTLSFPGSQATLNKHTATIESAHMMFSNWNDFAVLWKNQDHRVALFWWTSA